MYVCVSCYCVGHSIHWRPFTFHLLTEKRKKSFFFISFNSPRAYWFKGSLFYYQKPGHSNLIIIIINYYDPIHYYYYYYYLNGVQFFFFSDRIFLLFLVNFIMKDHFPLYWVTNYMLYAIHNTTKQNKMFKKNFS